MSRPDLRLELVEARAALRATNREIKRFTAESDFWLEDNQVYKKALEQQEKALARVEELTARLEIAADTAQERQDRVLDHYADALLAMADAIGHVVAGASATGRTVTGSRTT